MATQKTSIPSTKQATQGIVLEAIPLIAIWKVETEGEEWNEDEIPPPTETNSNSITPRGLPPPPPSSAAPTPPKAPEKTAPSPPLLKTKTAPLPPTSSKPNIHSHSNSQLPPPPPPSTSAPSKNSPKKQNSKQPDIPPPPIDDIPPPNATTIKESAVKITATKSTDNIQHSQIQPNQDIPPPRPVVAIPPTNTNSANPSKPLGKESVDKTTTTKPNANSKQPDIPPPPIDDIPPPNANTIKESAVKITATKSTDNIQHSQIQPNQDIPPPPVDDIPPTNTNTPRKGSTEKTPATNENNENPTNQPDIPPPAAIEEKEVRPSSRQRSNDVHGPPPLQLASNSNENLPSVVGSPPKKAKEDNIVIGSPPKQQSTSKTPPATTVSQRPPPPPPQRPTHPLPPRPSHPLPPPPPSSRATPPTTANPTVENLRPRGESASFPAGHIELHRKTPSGTVVGRDPSPLSVLTPSTTEESTTTTTQQPRQTSDPQLSTLKRRSLSDETLFLPNAPETSAATTTTRNEELKSPSSDSSSPTTERPTPTKIGASDDLAVRSSTLESPRPTLTASAGGGGVVNSRPTSSTSKKAPGLKLRTMTLRLINAATHLREDEPTEFSVSGPTNFRKYEVSVEGGELHSRLVDDQGREIKMPEPPPPPITSASCPAQSPSPREGDESNLVQTIASLVKKKQLVDLSLRPPQPPMAALREDMSALLSHMKEMDNKNWGDPELVDYWTSRPLPTEQWTETDPEAISLVDIASKTRGYHLEINSKSVTHDFPDCTGNIILNDDDDYPYYKDFFSTVPAHEVHVSLEGPCVVSLLFVGQLCKAIVRTKKDDKRITLPSDGWQRALKAFIPALKDLKFTKIKTPGIVQELLDYERTELIRKNFKFGVVYAKPNQHNEDDLFGEEHGSPAYDEFLEFLGEKIVLQGWTHFRAGLDVKSNNTGTHSVYTTFREHEIMYHVATLLPFVVSDKQKVERKRHIGNDVVVIVFKDQADSTDTFDPLLFTSHFIHCIFVITAAEKDAASGKTTHYRLTIANKPGVPPYPPFIPSDAKFPKNDEFRNFLLSKLINAGRVALGSPEFNSLLTARRERLTLICKNSLE